MKIIGNSFVHFLLKVLYQFKGNSIINFKRKYFTKDFLVKINLWDLRNRKKEGKKERKEERNLAFPLKAV